MARPTRRPSDAFLYSLAALLALFHAVLGLTAKIGTSVTFDELAHLTAGHVYNSRADFRLHPENGILPQRWAALPMAAVDPLLPDGDSNRAWQTADVWNYGRQFFYRSGNNSDFLIFCGRAMIALFSAGTGMLIFLWSRRLFGTRAGFLSLLLFVFCPTFLAHGALATSDVAMTFFFLAAISAWWWQLEKPSLWRTCASGFVLGLACVAKFSAVLLVPMMLVLAFLKIGHALRHKQPSASLVGRILLSAAVHGLLAWAIIWAFFGFRYAAAPLGNPLSFQHPWHDLLEGGGVIDAVIQHLREWRLLPEAFLYGFSFVRAYAHHRIAFFNGELSIDGWVAFFPFAFLVKTPLPLLLLCGVATASALGATRKDPARARIVLWTAAPLLSLFAVYWITALASTLNIGHRHILPTYPVVFIFLGGLISLTRPMWAGVLIVSLSLWHVVESLRIRPHYLAYFNQLVGGPKNGYFHLVDSSLDWGQDLPGLSRWLATHRAAGTPVYLDYFGTGDPAYEGIKAMTPAAREPQGLRHPWQELRAGIYCVSATSLQQPQPYARRGWTGGLESAYQALHRIARDVRDSAIGPDETARREGWTKEELNEAGNRYARLRFQRLCTYLRIRPADATIGYSIFVHQLSPEEIETAVDRPLDALIDMTTHAAPTRERSSSLVPE